ncbi:cytochrome P450 [Streptomonospora nanhaiensis]|uniref:Cytochrome P450 n=1 Tax=Streptomonospora nanhaiensis TaxID=1323731 RepID=A0A853BUH8_9ACTN|nr:cytochrome P450 [Streptomonospora nanhaiensis]MBV2365560.1 cytochrome P450 [Streptomonospora nanhaiensis]NYI98948.1 cytochrome P450 [Streptomonospora nanhaiensis]
MTGQVAAPPIPEAEPGSPGAPRAYAALRAHDPVCRVAAPKGEPAWLVTRHADVRAALADPRLVRPLAGTWPPGHPPARPPRPTLLELSGADHARHRSAAAAFLSPRRLEAGAGRIRALAHECADHLVRQGPPADLRAGFAAPFPLRVLCALLGVDPAEEAEFGPHVRTVLNPARVPSEAFLASVAALEDYAGRLADRGRRGPDSALPAALAADPALDRDGRALVVQSVLIAGYHTVVQHLGAALAALLQRPHGLAEVCASPHVLDTAVEELLRHVPLMNAFVLLVATEDLELGGRAIARGEAVMPVIASANRDRAVFADPDDLAPRRRPNPHLAFGRGPHHCLGAHLARMELRIGLAVLAERLPGARLAVPAHSLAWDDADLRAPLRLPATWST